MHTRTQLVNEKRERKKNVKCKAGMNVIWMKVVDYSVVADPATHCAQVEIHDGRHITLQQKQFSP